jgi:hypothetical protein
MWSGTRLLAAIASCSVFIALVTPPAWGETPARPKAKAGALDLSDPSFRNPTPRLGKFQAGTTKAQLETELKAKLQASPGDGMFGERLARCTLRSYEEPGQSVLPEGTDKAELLFLDDKLVKLTFESKYDYTDPDPYELKDFNLEQTRKLREALEQKYQRARSGSFTDYVTGETHNPFTPVKVDGPESRWFSMPEVRLYTGDGTLVVVSYAAPHRISAPDFDPDGQWWRFTLKVEYIAAAPVLQLKPEYEKLKAQAERKREAAEERDAEEQRGAEEAARQEQEARDRRLKERL